MNELRIATEIRKALDQSADRLPWRTTHRLQRAREAALARLPASSAELSRAPVLGPAGLQAGRGSLALGGGGHPIGQLAMRAAATLVPIALAVAGFMLISAWSDAEIADETADVELGVLTDEVPISAYADRGFGAYLKNSQHNAQ